MPAKWLDCEDGSIIGGTIESGTITSTTWDLEVFSFFFDLLVGAGITPSKNNKLWCEYFSIAVKWLDMFFQL